MEREVIVNWRVRMLCPEEAKSGSPGHYDLQLLGCHAIGGATYTNPAFSYSCEGSVGFLAIFDGSLSAAYYRRYLPYVRCDYAGVGASTPEQFRAFLDRIRDSVDANSGREIDIADADGKVVGSFRRYELTSPFRQYDMAAHNCFKAVGLWAAALGDGRLADYAQAHPYTDYVARAMRKNCPSLWVPALKGEPTEEG